MIIFFIYFQEEISRTLVDHWSAYKKRSESFPRLPKPSKSHLARYKTKSFFYKYKKSEYLIKDH
jgi:hypothetical protein